MPLTDAQSQALFTGISASGSLTNAAFNQIFAEHNRKRNFYYNEKAAIAADKRQRAQYEDLYSPQSMLEQYAAAGLSPSLMMSGGQSATGQSSAQGNQSAGIQGPYPSGQVIDPLQMAQIANINADTEGKKIDNVIKDIEKKIAKWEYQWYEREKNLLTNIYITDTETNETKSISDIAVQYKDFSDFKENLKKNVNWYNEDTKWYVDTEEGNKILRKIYEESHRTNYAVSQMLGDKEYANFMYDLYDKLNSADFAQLSADAQIAEMRKIAETQNLEADKKEVINNLFNGIENENLRAFVMILYMLGDRYLGSINGNVGASYHRGVNTNTSSSTSHNYNSNQNSSTSTNYNYRMR